MRKTIVAIFGLIFILTGFCMLHTTVKAEENIFEGVWSWIELEDGTVEIAKYYGMDTEIEIPSEISGKPVTSIGEFAFDDCNFIASIIIPAQMTDINWRYGFADCEALENIEIEGDNSKYCSFEGAVYSKDMSTLIWCPEGKTDEFQVPDGVVSVGKDAFFKCLKLNNITIPKSVSSIDEDAFLGCRSDIRLIVVQGSYAESYAQENRICHRFVGASEDACLHVYNTFSSDPICKGEQTNIHTCVNCGKSYTEIIPAIEHTYKVEITGAAKGVKGQIAAVCSECGNIKRTSTIPAIKSIKWSKTRFVYDGKEKRPTVKIVDRRNKVLKEGTDYTIEYPKSMKNPGIYVMKIHFTGIYRTTEEKRVIIRPKGTKITTTTGKSKGFTVKWKKQKDQISGYQIQYSTDSMFDENVKTLTIDKKDIKKTVSKLKKLRLYFLRIRTFKNVKVNGETTELCSSWSRRRCVETKR